MNRKILFLLALAIPLITIGAGCVQQGMGAENTSPTSTAKTTDEVTNESAKFKTYSVNQNGGFSFQYPADWNIKTNNSIQDNSIDVKVSSPEWNSPEQGGEFRVWMNPPGFGYEYLSKDLGSSNIQLDLITVQKQLLSDESGKINAAILKFSRANNAYFIKYEFVSNKDGDKSYYFNIFDNIIDTFKFVDTTSPDAVTAQWASKACAHGEMPLTALSAIKMPSGKFQGVAISDITKNYLALSDSKADTLTAMVSPNGKQLVVDYVSCDGEKSQNANGFTMDGTVSHLVVFTSSDAKSGKMLAHLPAFSGSNFGAIYLPVGFVGETSSVLVNGKIIDMGAGGSCATTYWMTINTDTAATTKFTTVPEYTVYAKNTHIVYVSPNSCVAPPQNIYVKNITTGAEQLIKKVSGDEFISMQGVEEKNTIGIPTMYVLNYSVLNILNQSNTPATVTLP